MLQLRHVALGLVLLLAGVGADGLAPAWFTAADVSPARKLAGGHCGPMSRELLQTVAKDNTVLITAVDQLVWKSFGPSFVENIQAANISYWLIAALDPHVSLAMGALGLAGHCFNAPQERLAYKGQSDNYQWGSDHWHRTTWNKVHIMRAVYELGFHIIQSDTDVTWFNDPLPYFMARMKDSRANILVCTDSVSSENPASDGGLEVAPHPYTNVNTGVYFMPQWPGGMSFFDEWLSWQPKNVGHDQDGFNYMTRGSYASHDEKMAKPIFFGPGAREFAAAYHNTTKIGFLPASSFGNTYTYVNAQLHKLLNHTLYEVHWVWGGNTLESKRQCMRDAVKFHDEDPYYTSPGLQLMTFDLDFLPMPEDYNRWRMTEKMIRFHVEAANHQLRQAYWAFAAALIANRTLVMPRFRCYCSKNWYQTQQCRINYEQATQFPFTCSLSQLLRTKRLEQGFWLPGNNEYNGHKVFIREYSFLENAKVPDEIKRGVVELVPSSNPRLPGLKPEQLLLTTEPSPRGYGQRVTVAAPMSDWELRALLAMPVLASARVLHLPAPYQILSGFSKFDTHHQYDVEIQKRVTYWCCRSPPDMRALNMTDRVQLVALPPDRLHNLPPLAPAFHAQYLHQLGPIPVHPDGGVS
ncbi:hypothetical protein HYH03_015592 [Edaphochlamys debaryana]|uniref:Nucleotide-diphospho-sugar transferase domain-containing protein n=1 Tax=Edaphochlamys debaryana TaxID=47281 RepID=A0A835XLW9_9CHLO|nr:hypothetical protein HYH03_015592 [Edaphochlamys debaryana]|eukprot:KAG2485707.1 hypothetical protein HYH03_015592 [Edaphochlamys debaryana]